MPKSEIFWNKIFTMCVKTYYEYNVLIFSVKKIKIEEIRLDAFGTFCTKCLFGIIFIVYCHVKIKKV